MEDFGMRLLELGDGRTVQVVERMYPALMEWSWHYDPETAQPVRIEEGTKIFLYNEEMRLARHDDFFPYLSRGAVRATFGHLPEYKHLLELTAKQREAALWEAQAQLPAMHMVLTDALSHIMARYWRWREKGEHLVYHMPSDFWAPGELKVEPITKLPASLGEFMSNEYTGAAIKDDSFLGIAPETIERAEWANIRAEWKFQVKLANLGYEPKVKPSEIARILKEADVPVWLMAEEVLAVLSHYPLPL